MSARETAELVACALAIVLAISAWGITARIAHGLKR